MAEALKTIRSEQRQDECEDRRTVQGPSVQGPTAHEQRPNFEGAAFSSRPIRARVRELPGKGAHNTEMGNNKVKSKGQLQGKKGNGKKDLHPQSRRVKQAARVDLREKRLKEVRCEI